MPTGLKISNAVFLTVGIVLLCYGGHSAFSNWRVLQSGIKTHGRVIRVEPHRERDGDTVQVPVVEFLTRDEQEIIFYGSSGSNPPAFRVDEEVPVLYDPGDPGQAFILTFMQFWGASVIFSGMGAIFTAIPGSMLLAQARRRSRARWLKQFGRRIPTKFEYVERVTNIKVDGDCPYRIISRWTDPATNREYVFRSFNLWHDPAALIDKRPDRSIDVLIDPSNPKRYWLDTDFLGDLAK